MSAQREPQQPQEPLATIDGNVPKQLEPFGANPFKKSTGAGGLLHPKTMSKNECVADFLTRLRSAEEKPNTSRSAGQYVSPSDNIVSPASAKLNAFKEKRFAKYVRLLHAAATDSRLTHLRSAKPRTLFASTKTISSDEFASPKSSKLKVAQDDPKELS